jgi:hypothetical protein
MVVREYLVENFGFDDSQLKTMSMGKQAGAGLDADWGSIQIIIYPAGNVISVDALPSASNTPITKNDGTSQVTAEATHQP